MRQLLICTLGLIALIVISCTESEPVVGSNSDTTIPNLSFSIDTTYLDYSNSKLVAKGLVKNNGSTNVSSPWYVECQFYTNGSKTTKLGGNYTQIGVPLSNGESTFWTVTYSSSNVDVRNYPNFAVGSMRGIYK